MALSGIIAERARLNMVANNISNVNTVGYKSGGAVFGEFLSARALETSASGSSKPAVGKAYPIELSTYINASQGPIKKTGNSLDLAINGGGYFVVRTPDGMKYTRNGVFSLNEAGELVNQDGYPVMGVNGTQPYINGNSRAVNVDNAKPIFLNERGSKVTITGAGMISLTDPQTDNQFYSGRILTVNFKNPEYLSKYGDTLFSETKSSGRPSQNQGSDILQGYVEESNVNMIRGMVQMIDVSEVYNNMIQVLKSYSQVNNTAINTIGAAV